jgi:fatty acid desaturase
MTNRCSNEEKEVLPPNKERDDLIKRFGAEAQILNDRVSKHLQEQEKKYRSLRRGLLWLALGLAFVFMLVAAGGSSVGVILAALKNSKSSSRFAQSPRPFH